MKDILKIFLLGVIVIGLFISCNRENGVTSLNVDNNRLKVASVKKTSSNNTLYSVDYTGNNPICSDTEEKYEVTWNGNDPSPMPTIEWYIYDKLSDIDMYQYENSSNYQIDQQYFVEGAKSIFLSASSIPESYNDDEFYLSAVVYYDSNNKYSVNNIIFVDDSMDKCDQDYTPPTPPTCDADEVYDSVEEECVQREGEEG